MLSLPAAAGIGGRGDWIAGSGLGPVTGDGKSEVTTGSDGRLWPVLPHYLQTELSNTL